MAWSVYQFYVVDETGVVLPSATVTVRDTLNVIALIASDEAGTPMDNPFQADDTGLAVFYAQSGRYNITAQSGAVTVTFNNVPIGSARGVDVGTDADQVSTNEMGDARWITRTQEIIEVDADATAQPEWAGRIIRVTAAANITIPDTSDPGFGFDVQRATTDAVGFLLDGADVFEPSFGDGTGVTAITIHRVNGWASLMKMAAGIIAVVGQIEDATP